MDLATIDLDSDSDEDAELLTIKTSKPAVTNGGLFCAPVPGPETAASIDPGVKSPSSSFNNRLWPTTGSIIASSQSSSGSSPSTGTNGLVSNCHKLNTDTLGTYIYPTNLPPRDYQMNIVQKALYHNLLCALPTGMGKTFIASTVMLNWYRWTVDAKIVFVAPTRPLVSQQIEACLGITGIPRSDACVMIGSLHKQSRRVDLWQTKRVFFATPQIVEGDLKKGLVDPKSIACLVIDEAHRATGNYSYVQIVNFIHRFQDSCRVLALTATPSGNIEGVQQIIDNLKISRIEIRTEDSIDVRRHVHKRTTTKIKTEQSEDAKMIIENLGRAVKPLLTEVNKLGAYHIREIEGVTQFGVLQALQRYTSSPAANLGIGFKVRAIMSLLIKIGQAMNLLKVHGIIPFYNCLNDMKKEAENKKKSDKKKKSNKDTLLSHEGFIECMKHCEDMIFDPNTGGKRADFIGHEKLKHVVDIVNNFLLENPESRGIIFAEYRDSAAEIERVLKYFCPTTAKPHLFIGQTSTEKKKGKDKSAGNTSKTGMKQKDQEKVVDKFKAGEYNILVSTSIGEEGLDIGEVDLIICYDQSKSPIRIIQRMGRTGRKREGQIYLLMNSEEEKKVEHSFGGYKYIQDQINKEQKFTYCQNNRILPASIKPICEKKFIEIPEENREVLVAKEKAKDIIDVLKAAEKPSMKRKKAIPKKFFMPENVHTGFLPASKVEVDDDGVKVLVAQAEVKESRKAKDNESDHIEINPSQDHRKSEGIPKQSSEHVSPLSTVIDSSRDKKDEDLKGVEDIDSNNTHKVESLEMPEVKKDTKAQSLENQKDQLQKELLDLYNDSDDDTFDDLPLMTTSSILKLEKQKPETSHSKISLSRIIKDTAVNPATSTSPLLANKTPSINDKNTIHSQISATSLSLLLANETTSFDDKSIVPPLDPATSSSPLLARKTDSFNDKNITPPLRNFFNLRQIPGSPPVLRSFSTAAPSSIASCEPTEGFLSEADTLNFNSLYKIDNPPDDIEYDPLVGVQMPKPPHIFIPHSTATQLFHTAIQKMQTPLSSYDLKRPTLFEEFPSPKRSKN